MAYDKREYNREYSKRTNYAAQKKNKTKKKSVYLLFDLINDGDILYKLECVENKTDYIRQLIRNDLKNNM